MTFNIHCLIIPILKKKNFLFNNHFFIKIKSNILFYYFFFNYTFLIYSKKESKIVLWKQIYLIESINNQCILKS